MITDADIKKLKQVFATKDDLKRFVTKDDLKLELTILHKEIAELKFGLEKMLSSMMLLFRDLREEMESGFSSLREEIMHEKIRRETQLDNHEQRIQKLEQKSFINA